MRTREGVQGPSGGIVDPVNDEGVEGGLFGDCFSPWSGERNCHEVLSLCRVVLTNKEKATPGLMLVTENGAHPSSFGGLLLNFDD